jgi:hypothetical protein
MESIYHNPSHPAAFGGRKPLQTAGNFKTKDVDLFLKSNKVYRKFKRNQTKFKRARIFVGSVAHMFQADLMDVQKLSRKNAGHNFILILVDAFSRFLIAKPLKNKSAVEVSKALSEAFSELKMKGLLAPSPLLATDLGTEFWNSHVKTVLGNYNISHFALRAPKKASLAENSGRYLMDRIYKFMYFSNKDRWIDHLQSFVNAKNSRRNPRLANLAPKDVNYDNQAKVYESLYPDRFDRHESQPLAIGQRVQMAYDAIPFHKSYKGYFKDNIYEIKNRVDYNGIYRYALIDTQDNYPISGTYYAEELQPF